jgi:oxidase EvaA
MIKSLLTLNSVFDDIDSLKTWIERTKNDVRVVIDRIPFSEMNNWYLDRDGSIRHNSGKFFSIEGIHVVTDYGCTKAWDQPIIDQHEVGYLGILAKEFNGVLYFLMQAKIEPGNINYVQISPTLQATKSNYNQIHKGKKPAYLDYFVNAKPHQILLDQLQSEQGARFLRKRNRNIIVKVDDDIEVNDDFRWMTLAQIKELIQFENIINMDTRTVISGINFGDYMTPMINKHQMSKLGLDFLHSLNQKNGLFSMNEHLSWLSNLKSKYDLLINRKPILNLSEWDLKNDEISRSDGKYFKVIGVNVEISSREVSKWSQPLIMPMQEGLCAFIVKKIGNVYHFLVQAKLECGNFDVMELAPTVQCLTGNVFESENKPPFVDLILNIDSHKIIYDTKQSEEGGRFYREQNRNMIVEFGDEMPDKVPDCYRWMTLGQLFEFLKFNNFLNIQARSLISAIKFI